MARANTLALAAAVFCLLNIACVFAAPELSQWESDVQAEAEEQRAGQEVQVAEEAEDEAEADADFASLLQQEQSEQQRAGEEQQQQQEEAEGEQQRVQGKEAFGRLSNQTSGKLGDQQKDLENEQRNQQTQGRQDDFGLEGRQQQVLQGGQWPPAQQGGPKRPPQGYDQLMPNGYFKVHTTPRTWLEALLTCSLEGGQLAVPRSEAEVFALGRVYTPLKARVNKAQDRELFFIGAHDLLKEGEFVTIIGTKFKENQYHRWQKGEPNNHGKVEHCVLSNDKGLYWDGNCMKKYAFICEYRDPCKNTSPGSSWQQGNQGWQQGNQGWQQGQQAPQPPQRSPQQPGQQPGQQPARQTHWQQRQQQQPQQQQGQQEWNQQW